MDDTQIYDIKVMLALLIKDPKFVCEGEIFKTFNTLLTACFLYIYQHGAYEKIYFNFLFDRDSP
jgi:hypothetical protein